MKYPHNIWLLIASFLVLNCSRGEEYTMDFVSRYDIRNTSAGYIAIPIQNGEYEFLDNTCVRGRLYYDFYRQEYKDYTSFLYDLLNNKNNIIIPQDFIIGDKFYKDDYLVQLAKRDFEAFRNEFLDVEDSYFYCVKKEYGNKEAQILQACFESGFFVYFSCVLGTWSVGEKIMCLPDV